MDENNYNPNNIKFIDAVNNAFNFIIDKQNKSENDILNILDNLYLSRYYHNNNPEMVKCYYGICDILFYIYIKKHNNIINNDALTIAKESPVYIAFNNNKNHKMESKKILERQIKKIKSYYDIEIFGELIYLLYFDGNFNKS